MQVQAPTGGYYKIEKLKKRVKARLSVGDRFEAQADFYNYEADTHRKKTRWVMDFKDNFVITKDESGRKESFLHYDLYMILTGKKGEEYES